MMLPEKMSDAEIAYVSSLKEEAGLDWSDITQRFNKKFKKDRTLDSVKKSYHRNRDRLDNPSEYVRLYKDVARTKRASTLNSKDLKKLVDQSLSREDIVDAIKGSAKELNKLVTPKAVKLPKFKKGKKGMTLELLISDVHVGKLTRTFNNEVLKRRLKQISDTTIKEMQRAAEHYKIDKIILAFLGDMIESATMHGTESSKGCEFGNSRQVQECLTHCFQLIVVPVAHAAAKLGAEIECIGVTGNHDRTEVHRTYNQPGAENVTWIIYKTMEEFCKVAGLKNISWKIPEEPYQLVDIYGEKVLYEHYDNAKGNTRVALESLMAKRVNQLKTPIRFMRGGHYHSPTEYDVGKIVTNGNVPGNDGYSTVLGFDCEPCQTLNFYIKREKSDSIKRETSFYKRFLIQLN